MGCEDHVECCTEARMLGKTELVKIARELPQRQPYRIEESLRNININNSSPGLALMWPSTWWREA